MSFTSSADRFIAALPIAIDPLPTWPRADCPKVRLSRHADLTDADRARWADLSTCAGQVNIFAQMWFMDAALRHCRGEQDIRLLIVARPDGSWIGMLPLALEHSFGRWPLRSWESWKATNQFLASPLVRTGAEIDFWTALLVHLDAHPAGAVALQCVEFAEDDPACAALVALCERQSRKLFVTDRFERPAREPGFPVFSADASGRKLRARLGALERRLVQDHGAVTIDVLPADQSCEAWIDGFLTLESAGWKGRRNSALACDPCNDRLFRTVIRQGHADGTARLATLSAGGRPLAMTSWLVSGSRGYGFKMAFDEAHRSYAPGQLLMRHVAEAVAGDAALHFDTCMCRDAGGCHRMWPGRRAIFDCAIAIGSPARRATFAAMMRITQAFHRMRRRGG